MTIVFYNQVSARPKVAAKFNARTIRFRANQLLLSTDSNLKRIDRNSLTGSKMELCQDILSRIRDDFPSGDFDLAVELLVSHHLDGRLARCAIFAANGSLKTLREWVERAAVDFRDVIVAGEYDHLDQHVRDLSNSFLVESNDFWISDAAGILASFGFQLVFIDSRPATVEPFELLSDRYEGTAVFERARDSIRILKTDHRWALEYNGNPIHSIFTDQRQFERFDELEPLLHYILADAG